MTLAFLLVSCVVFIELFLLLGIADQAYAIVTGSREAMGVLASRELDDEAKEAAVRRASLEMFKATGLLVLKFGVIVIALWALFAAVVALSPGLEQPILRSFVSPLAIVGLTVAAAAYAWARHVVVKQL